LLEEDASIYDTSVPLGTSLTQLDPNAYRPDAVYAVTGLTATNVSIAGSGGTIIDAIKVSWATPSDFVDFTEGGYRVSGQTDYQYAKATSRDNAILAPVQPGTLYEFRARHVTIEGVAGPYATTSITAGATTVIGSSQIADDAVTLAKFAEGIEPVRIVTTLPTTKLTEVVFLTTNAKLYRWNGTAYVASIPTSDLTGTIVSTQIADDSISTPKLQANAITAGKIATNAITSDKIEANAIVAGKIAAAAVSADALAADSVSVVKLISNTSKTYGTGSTFQFEFGTTTQVAGYQGAGILRTAATNGFGVGALANSSDSFAVAGQQANNAGSSYGAGFLNSTVLGGTTHRTIAFLTNNVRAGFFQDYSSGTPVNNAQLCNGTYAIETSGNVHVVGNITATGTITPFTGSHDGLVADAETPEPGDILLDVEIVARKGISDTLALMTTSSAANQPAIGVFNSECPTSYIPSAIAKIIPAPETAPGVPETETIVDPDLAYLLEDRKVITVNSVGEGQINVCGEGGNISAGDLIVTSSIPGKGMRQDDDIIRGKTVAKARESATFEDESDIKQIACIYLCG
jgi:hypothetical protein